MIETMSVENLNRANFDIDVGGNDNMASLRYKLDSEADPTSRSSNIMFADVHSDSDGVLFKNMSENVNMESVELKTNEFMTDQKKKGRQHPEDQLLIIKSALIDLYLSVKIRTNEEIDIYDENQLAKERKKLESQNKVDEMTLIEYIKLSIEILMNMKYEDFEKEANILNKERKQNFKESQPESSHFSGNNTNRFMT
jgi:hypothetical protein